MLRVLRSGGSATVYEAVEEGSDSRVALKVLHPDLRDDPHYQAQLRLEAELSARLRHRGVAAVLALREHEGSPVLVEELLCGEDLAQHLARRGALDVAEAIAIARTVLEVLATTHAVGVVHRDLNPANIFLARIGAATTPTLLDFGVALVGESPPVREGTASRRSFGTLRFMALEQLVAPHRIDPRSDLFAVGLLLYLLLTGRHPFDDLPPTELGRAIVDQRYPPLRTLRPDVSPDLDAAIRRALRPWPEERHETAEAMLADLVASAPSIARDTPAPEPATTADEPTGPVAVRGETQR